MAEAGSTDTVREEYQAGIRRNYRGNYPLGVAQGLFFAAAVGFYGYGTFFSNLVFELSGSNQIVGLVGAIVSGGFAFSQLWGMNIFEPLSQKKRTLLFYGLAHRLAWLLMGLVVWLLPRQLALGAVLLLFGIGQCLLGLYSLGFFDLMAKTIPIEQRGNYFGLRNSLGTGAQALTGILAGWVIGRYSYGYGSTYQGPLGYALCFFIAFLAHLIDLYFLSRLTEEPTPVVGRPTPLRERLAGVPRLLRTDRGFAWYCYLRPLIQIIYAVFPFTIIYARQRVVMAAGAGLGILSAVDLTFMALGTYTFGRLVNRFGFIKILASSAVLRAGSFISCLWLNSYLSFLVFFAVGGFLDGGVVLSLDSLMMEFGSPENRSTYIAISSVIAGGVGIILPIAAGWLIDRFSYGTVFFAAGLMILLAAVLLTSRVTDPRRVSEYW